MEFYKIYSWIVMQNLCNSIYSSIKLAKQALFIFDGKVENDATI